MKIDRCGHCEPECIEGEAIFLRSPETPVGLLRGADGVTRNDRSALIVQDPDRMFVVLRAGLS